MSSKAAKQLHPPADKVTSWGLYGKCASCLSPVQSTTVVASGKRVCRQCQADQFTSDPADLIYTDSDAKFECPASKTCGAKDLSRRQFWIGSCCKNGAKETSMLLGHDDERTKCESLSIVTKIFNEAREDEVTAECDAKMAGEELIQAQKVLQKAQAACDNAKEKVIKANESLLNKKTWRKKAQKRVLVCASFLSLEDSDPETEPETSVFEETSEEEPVVSRDEPKSTLDYCKLCYEDYDKKEHLLHKCVYEPCSHFGCMGCFSKTKGSCPFCKKSGHFISLYER